MPPFFEGALNDTVCLSVEQTVPRSLVHKRSHENVLLTETRAAGDDRFLCAGRIPTAHRFFNDAGRTPQRDILFYTELGRQASLAISHVFLEVSQDDVFIFEGSEAAVTDVAWTNATLLSQDAVAVEVRVRETARRRNGALSRVVADHLMCIDGQPVFYGTGAWTVQPAALFQRLRRTSATRSAASAAGLVPSELGRSVARLRPVDNVVISAPEPAPGRRASTASLVVDDRHPYFFDHPCDHVPGMLLLEGCAQLAVAASAEAAAVPPAGIAAYEVNFAQFVECGIPAILEAELHSTPATDGAPATVEVTISQAGVVAGTATMRLTPSI
jgi:3-hydroxymyristoyl/3-hydroxydecanoyl-(acyl carrier protein) dehydratase